MTLKGHTQINPEGWRENQKKAAIKSITGIKRSKETRKKMSISKIGILNPSKRLEVREKMRIAKKGTHRSIETRKKIGKKLKGEKCHLWKGGIYPLNLAIRKSLKYKLWRESIFKRDNWTCQLCGKKGGKLQAHHKKKFSEYPKLIFMINNGITLCKKCHNKIHSILTL